MQGQRTIEELGYHEAGSYCMLVNVMKCLIWRFGVFFATYGMMLQVFSKRSLSL